MLGARRPTAQHTALDSCSYKPTQSTKIQQEFTMSTPYSMKLNHLMQSRHQEASLSMSEKQVGGLWQIQYKFNGEVKGTGTAPQKNAAREMAAQQAYTNLGGN